MTLYWKWIVPLTIWKTRIMLYFTEIWWERRKIKHVINFHIFIFANVFPYMTLRTFNLMISLITLIWKFLGKPMTTLNMCVHLCQRPASGCLAPCSTCKTIVPIYHTAASFAKVLYSFYKNVSRQHRFTTFMLYYCFSHHTI